MFQLIYSSEPASSLSQQALKTIALESNFRNQALNISGILVMSDDTIMQVLEGDEAAVRNLYDIIQQDSRHSNCTVLLERHTIHRSFSEWSLGYANAQEGYAYELRQMVTALKASKAKRGLDLKLAS